MLTRWLESKRRRKALAEGMASVFEIFPSSSRRAEKSLKNRVLDRLAKVEQLTEREFNNQDTTLTLLKNLTNSNTTKAVVVVEPNNDGFERTIMLHVYNKKEPNKIIRKVRIA